MWWGMPAASPQHFSAVSARNFSKCVCEISALEFLRNLKDNPESSFISMSNVECLSNLVDNIESLFLLENNVECLWNLADNLESLFISMSNLECLSSLTDNRESLFFLVNYIECLSNLLNITRIESFKMCNVFNSIKAICLIFIGLNSEQI
jgi:hypothetical protein